MRHNNRSAPWGRRETDGVCEFSLIVMSGIWVYGFFFVADSECLNGRS